MEDRFLAVGKNISLRKITRDDTHLVIKWRNNERVRSHFIYRETFTAPHHENWLKEKVDTGKVLQFIICENDRDHRPVGSVYFIFRNEDRTEAEYGIFIGEDDAVGKGYGNETAVLATEYVKENTPIKKLILRVFTSNEVARKSYEYGGFVKIQDLPAVECSDGEKSDMILMEKILKE